MVVGSKSKFKVFCGIFDLGSCNDNIVAHSLLARFCGKNSIELGQDSVSISFSYQWLCQKIF